MLETVLRAKTLWNAARDVGPADERPLWRLPDEMFAVVELRLSTLAESQGSFPNQLEMQAAILQAQCEELLRLPSNRRSGHLEKVYLALMNFLASAEAMDAHIGGKPDVKSAHGEKAGLRREDLEQYASDAAAQSRLMWAYYLAAALLIVAAVGGLAWIVGSQKLVAVGSLVTLIGFSSLLILALAAGHQARECRRAVFETRRVYRQLLIVEKYLDPMPQVVRDLMRGVMMQRLFPRLIDDENPMREDEPFPDPDKLLIALNPQYAEMRRRRTGTQTASTQATTTQSAPSPPAPGAQPVAAEAPSASAPGSGV